MTDPYFTQIKQFYNRCRHDEALPPGDDRYVDLSAKGVRGREEPRKMLSKAIQLSNTWTYQLFTGFSGAGKSTELQLLRRDLERETSYIVVYQDAEEIIDTTQPLHVTDILVTLGVMAEQAVLGVLSPDQVTDTFKESFWQRLYRFFTDTKVDPESVDVKFGSVSFKTKLRSNPTFREQVRKDLEGRLHKFHQECKDFLLEVNSVIKSRANKDGVVFIIDSMEKITGDSLNAEKVAQSVQTTFYGNAPFLTDIPCHMIYTIPPFLHLMEPDLPKAYSDSPQILPMCRVHEQTTREPNLQAIQVLQDFLAKRVSLSVLFGDDWQKVSQKLILASGGYPRDLLLLIRHILQRTDTLPVSSDTLDYAIQKLFDAYQGAIYENDLKWLARIAISHDKELLDEKQLMRMVGLFRSHVVMCYYNGSPWYDLHPAVYQMERIQLTIEKEKELLFATGLLSTEPAEPTPTSPTSPS